MRMYHPGKVETIMYAPFSVPFGAGTQGLRWTCCGAIFQAWIYPNVAPPGCMPLDLSDDLTLRVTTVTRAAPPARSTEPESGQAA